MISLTNPINIVSDEVFPNIITKYIIKGNTLNRALNKTEKMKSELSGVLVDFGSLRTLFPAVQ